MNRNEIKDELIRILGEVPIIYIHPTQSMHVVENHSGHLQGIQPRKLAEKFYKLALDLENVVLNFDNR